MFYLLSFLSIFNIFSSSCGKNEENSTLFLLTGWINPRILACKNCLSKSEGDLRDEEVNEIAKKLAVKKDEVISMNRRLSGKEHSLNAPIGEDGDEWQDWIIDKEMDQELKFAQKEEMNQRRDLLKDSIKILNDREKEILYARRLNEEPTTLEDLSKKHKISRERIRQIENKAFEKLQKHMLNSAKSKNLLPAS